MLKKSQVLKDHRRHKKVFTPPLMQLPNLNLTEWKAERLPELLWIGCFLETYGFHYANHHLMAFIRIVKESHTKNQSMPTHWLALTSSYSAIGDEIKAGIIDGCRREKILNTIRAALNDLHHFYPEVPFSFLFAEKQIAFKAWNPPDLDFIKKVVRKMFHRHEQTSVLVSSIALNMAGEILTVTEEIGRSLDECYSHLNELVSGKVRELDPMVAVKITSHIGALHAIGSIGDAPKSIWPSQFWNRGFELENCSTL